MAAGRSVDDIQGGCWGGGMTWHCRFAVAAAAAFALVAGSSACGDSPSGGNSSTFTISGAVSGAIADGVLITLSGSITGTTTTAGGGLYSFSSLTNGNYTLTPSKAGYSFTPASIAVTVNGGNITGQNFPATAPPRPYCLHAVGSGAIADGVLITLSGSITGTTTTAGGGLYSFSNLTNGNYTLTPSKAGYSFTPASIAVTVNGGNVTGQNFTATAVPVPYSIS